MSGAWVGVSGGGFVGCPGFEGSGVDGIGVVGGSSGSCCINSFSRTPERA